MRKAGVIFVPVFILWGTFIVQALYIPDNATAEKGESVQLVCGLELTPGAWSSNLYASETAVCYEDRCLQHQRRYHPETDGSDVYINISNLNRSEDEMFWTCAYEYTRTQMFLTVYTTPTASLLSSSFGDFYDLSGGLALLTCRTDICVYKNPILGYWVTGILYLRIEIPILAFTG